MKIWLLALALQTASPVPAPQAALEGAPAAPAVQAYAGTLRAGRLELAQLSKQDKHDEAARLSAALLAAPDFERTSEAERAETLYAVGVAAGRAGDVPGAVEAFHRARGLAGSAQLGLDAAYNSGTYLLLGAEELRRQIPEVREKLGLPPLAPAPGGPAAPAGPGAAPGAPAESPDPLLVAREAYLRARGELAEAWRAAPSDADTRANLELAVKRLRELDALQKQREEQQQQQQDQQQDSKQDPNSQQQKDPQQKPQDEQDPQQQDPQQSKDDESSERKPDEQPQPQEEQQSEPKQDQAAQPDAAQKELQLSPEEMARLLDQLQKIDEQARQVEALLRERRRTPVKKDW